MYSFKFTTSVKSSSDEVTYGRIVTQIRPQKTETHRVRLTVGSNRLEYAGSVSTPTANLTTAKCLLNSTISTPQGCFMVDAWRKAQGV
jgi:hypothetical protein